ncbi:Uncharacterized protein PODLI_1B014270 [Podarcis lilfordi]|uniref:Calcium homeostasis modulator family member 6 n=1 Tax=Podarcis lilfordi TaxID=74358 RepID=A0AA35P001_9SAUR|nr:Uncharacterized protein PODLI_1B014270 [Podarcis lilfordi]
MDKFHAVFDFCLNHQKALGYGAVSLLTVGSERIFSAVVFKCPCNSWNMLYGLVFLLVPALILFLLGFLLSSQSWKILTGSCAPNRLCRCPHGTRFRHYLKVLGLVIVRASVAPLTWIAVALLGSRFYECAASGSSSVQAYMCKGKGDECVEKMPQVPCQSGTATSEMQDILMSLQAQSQSVFSSLPSGKCTWSKSSSFLSKRPRITRRSWQRGTSSASLIPQNWTSFQLQVPKSGTAFLPCSPLTLKKITTA